MQRWLTCVSQSQKIAKVCGALCVYSTHCLRAQSLFEKVRRTHSPHYSSIFLPERRCPHYSIYINHSWGVHGDMLTREWLNILHLTGNGHMNEHMNATVRLWISAAPLSSIPFLSPLLCHWSRPRSHSSSSSLWPWPQPDGATDLGPAYWSNGTSAT